MRLAPRSERWCDPAGSSIGPTCLGVLCEAPLELLPNIAHIERCRNASRQRHPRQPRKSSPFRWRSGRDVCSCCDLVVTPRSCSRPLCSLAVSRFSKSNNPFNRSLAAESPAACAFNCANACANGIATDYARGQTASATAHRLVPAGPPESRLAMAINDCVSTITGAAQRKFRNRSVRPDDQMAPASSSSTVPPGPTARPSVTIQARLPHF